MSYSLEYPIRVDQAPADARAAFIRRTYGHLAGAVLAFIGLSYVLLQIPAVGTMVRAVDQNRMLWFVVIGAFMAVNWVADYWARSDQAPAMQYLGLGLTVTGWALVFVFPLWWAAHEARYQGVIQSAGLMTFGVFAGLTAAVLFTRRDYSFLGPVISIGSFVALAFIAASILFGFNLGVVFCFAMVALASASIIYNTSNIIHQYNTNQHVAAAMGLFASVALLFWYILQIAMASRE